MATPDEFPFWLFKTGGSDWDLKVQPSADTFIAPDLSVGGVVRFHTNGAFTDVGLGGRAGYAIPLGARASLWLRGGVFFHRTSFSGGGSSTETVLDLRAPFLFHIAPPFFVGVGPFVALPIQRSDDSPKDATFGLMAIVGGYLH
jgi:hypothetical protein